MKTCFRTASQYVASRLKITLIDPNLQQACNNNQHPFHGIELSGCPHKTLILTKTESVDNYNLHLNACLCHIQLGWTTYL